MGNYQLPKTSAGLIQLGTGNIAGLKAYGTELEIKLITEAQATSNLAAFVEQDGLYNAARSLQQTASDTYQATLGPIYTWLLGVSNTLATKFGTRWNTEWAQAGFTNRTTAIPSKIEDRMALALALVNFFTANPSYQVPSLNQTAAYGTTLREATLAAQAAWTAATIAFNDAGTAWDTAYTALTDGMRALLRNLSSVLSNSDPRWLSFGFAMPSTPSTPGKPGNVTAQVDQTGAILLQWDAVPLATRYRVRRMIVGVENAYTLACSSTEPIGTIKGIQPGQTVQIIVQAVNETLQGVASDPILCTIPLVTKKVETAEPMNGANHREVAAPSGNGYANGQANGSRQPTLV